MVMAKIPHKILAVKVWCPEIEDEPEGSFSRRYCTGVPSEKWFAEAPSFAARLYANELQNSGLGSRHRINIFDNQGELHRFSVELVGRSANIMRIKKA